MFTVEGLIEALKNAPPEAEVFFCNDGAFWRIHVVRVVPEDNIVELYNDKDLKFIH